jgi:hypothetical protein
MGNLSDDKFSNEILVVSGCYITTDGSSCVRVTLRIDLVSGNTSILFERDQLPVFFNSFW